MGRVFEEYNYALVKTFLDLNILIEKKSQVILGV